METIILDDIPPNVNTQIIDIDLDDDNGDDIVEILDTHPRYNKEMCFDRIAKECRLLWEFIEKCLELENSRGMERAIMRSLIPAYDKTAIKFRETDLFKSIVTKAICNIQHYPEFKFSHVKELCENLRKRNYVDRKRFLHKIVLDGAPKGQKHHPYFSRKHQSKVKRTNNVTEIVLSDESDSFEVPIMPIDEKQNVDNGKIITKALNAIQNDITVIEEIPIEFIQIDDDPDNSNKIETNNGENIQEIVEIMSVEDEIMERKEKKDQGIQLVDNEKENSASNIMSTAKDNNIEKSQAKADKNDNITTICLSDEEIVENCNVGVITPNNEKLLVPQKEEQSVVYDQMLIENKIKHIEEQINFFKMLVDKFEQEEVVDDSTTSPYILCEEYKSKIVTLYKHLCKLTGQNPVKRREVRLKAVDIRSQLPMLKLEELINSNIGRDGLPKLPDFCDVVKCVKDANKEGHLKWTSQMVMREARTLFTHCGRALQQNRQQREWRHMLRLVKQEVIEDPADSDPELMARLQANKRHANCREKELFDRYSEMDDPQLQVAEKSDNSENSDNENHNYKSPYRDCPSKRVRITPTPVPYEAVPHEIVQESNQIPKVEVSNDTRLINDNFLTPNEDKVSDVNSGVNDVTLPIISGTFSLKDAALLFAITTDEIQPSKLLQPENNTEILEHSNALCSINVPNSRDSVISNATIHQISQPNQFYTETAPNEEPTSNTKEISVSSNVVSNCSISLMQALAVGKDILSMFKENKGEDEPKNTIVNENSNCCNNSDGADQLNEISSSNNTIEAHETELANANTDVLSENTQEVKMEFEEEVNLIQEVCSRDETCNENTSESPDTTNTDMSSNILEHFLRARVVLTRTDIKLGVHNKDTYQVDKVLNGDTETESGQDDELDINIKQECVDIQKELDELGDNFTTTIIDIEDPYLVVEVSSDSSDDEEEPEVVAKDGDI